MVQSHEEDGFRLGSWANTQRGNYDRGQLPADRVRRLESLQGWSWNPQDARWDKGFRILQSYVERTGDAQPKQSCVVDSFNLGTWVTTQRVSYTKGKLPPERVRRLEKVPGWVWNPADAAWEANYTKLLDYVRANSSARVPQGHRVDGIDLGGWLQRQRDAYFEGTLGKDRQRRLDTLPDWSWGHRARRRG